MAEWWPQAVTTFIHAVRICFISNATGCLLLCSLCDRLVSVRIKCIKTSFTSIAFGSLTCQPSLPDIPPQQIPSLGRGVPQLLADRPPQLKLGRPSLGSHCGAAGHIFPDCKKQRSVNSPLFLNPFIPASPRRLGRCAPAPLLRLAAAMIVTASPGIKAPLALRHLPAPAEADQVLSRDLDPLKL